MQILGKNITNKIFKISLDRKRIFDHFEPNFLLLYIIEGTLSITIDNKLNKINKQTYLFVNKNHLAKLEMNPEPNGRFRAIYVLLKNEFLQSQKLYTFPKFQISDSSPIDFHYQTLNSSNILLNAYFQYLKSVLDKNYIFDNEMESLKLQEAIYMLIQLDKKFQNYLFSNKVYNKIDLDEFMNKSFQFNIPLSRFAELTGRSLSSFKRDFYSQFKTTPSKWLLNKRLSYAYYLLQKGSKPSDIYLNIGFESFSHFSKCFKDKYGLSPRKIHPDNK